jgi:hypothetical protein
MVNYHFYFRGFISPGIDQIVRLFVEGEKKDLYGKDVEGQKGPLRAFLSGVCPLTMPCLNA